jgi:hypothetical protein
MEGCPATVQQHNPYLQGVDNLLMDIVEHFCRCELERQALEIRSPSRTAAHRHPWWVGVGVVELQTTDLTGDLWINLIARWSKKKDTPKQSEGQRTNTFLCCLGCDKQLLTHQHEAADDLAPPKKIGSSLVWRYSAASKSETHIDSLYVTVVIAVGRATESHCVEAGSKDNVSLNEVRGLDHLLVQHWVADDARSIAHVTTGFV